MSDERKEIEFFIDKSGREVKVGDFIVYGHNLGRCAGLRFGKVLKIAQVEDNWLLGKGILSWRITVQGVNDDWGDKDVQLASKGCLQFPERILNANDFIPEKYKKLLTV
jgi:hypothetical protein